MAEGGAQAVCVGRGVPRGLDRGPDGGQVDTIALQHLMIAMCERLARRFFIANSWKACFESVRDCILALAAQAGEDTAMMRAELECVAKGGLGQPRDIFMPLVIVRARQDFPVSGIHLADAKMPVATERLLCRALLGMLDHDCPAGIETKFASQRIHDAEYLLAGGGLQRRDDPVPYAVASAMLARIAKEVGQVALAAAQDDDG